MPLRTTPQMTCWRSSRSPRTSCRRHGSLAPAGPSGSGVEAAGRQLAKHGGGGLSESGQTCAGSGGHVLGGLLLLFRGPWASASVCGSWLSWIFLSRFGQLHFHGCAVRTCDGPTGPGRVYDERARKQVWCHVCGAVWQAVELFKLPQGCLHLDDQFVPRPQALRNALASATGRKGRMQGAWN